MSPKAQRLSVIISNAVNGIDKGYHWYLEREAVHPKWANREDGTAFVSTYRYRPEWFNDVEIKIKGRGFTVSCGKEQIFESQEPMPGDPDRQRINGELKKLCRAMTSVLPAIGALANGIDILGQCGTGRQHYGGRDCAVHQKLCAVRDMATAAGGSNWTDSVLQAYYKVRFLIELNKALGIRFKAMGENTESAA